MTESSRYDHALGSKLLSRCVEQSISQLEDAITLLSRAPNGPETSSLMGAAIRLLYTDLPHPPSTSLGETWQFRSADGSGNSRVDPALGKAGTPYSRSCSSAASLPYSHLPDPGLVFDLLIKRDEVSTASLIPSIVGHLTSWVSLCRILQGSAAHSFTSRCVLLSRVEKRTKNSHSLDPRLSSYTRIFEPLEPIGTSMRRPHISTLGFSTEMTRLIRVPQFHYLLSANIDFTT